MKEIDEGKNFKQDYSYGKWVAFQKLIFVILIVGAGLLIRFFLPIHNRYQTILVYLIYISGIVLFFLEALPVLIRSFIVWNKEILLTNQNLIIKGKNKMETAIINRHQLEEVKFIAWTSENFVIPLDRPVKDIDKKIYKIIGRKILIKTIEGEKYIIYLELLPNDFFKEFISWYHGEQVF